MFESSDIDDEKNDYDYPDDENSHRSRVFINEAPNLSADINDDLPSENRYFCCMIVAKKERRSEKFPNHKKNGYHKKNMALNVASPINSEDECVDGDDKSQEINHAEKFLFKYSKKKNKKTTIPFNSGVRGKGKKHGKIKKDTLKHIHNGGNHQRTNIYITKDPYLVLKCINENKAFPPESETEVAMTVVSLITNLLPSSSKSSSLLYPDDISEQNHITEDLTFVSEYDHVNEKKSSNASNNNTVDDFLDVCKTSCTKSGFIQGEIGKFILNQTNNNNYGANYPINVGIDYNRALEIARAIEKKSDIQELHSELKLISQSTFSNQLKQQDYRSTNPRVFTQQLLSSAFPYSLRATTTQLLASTPHSHYHHEYSNGTKHKYSMQEIPNNNNATTTTTIKKQGTMRNHKMMSNNINLENSSKSKESDYFDPKTVDNTNGNYRLGMIIGSIENKQAARVLAAMWGLKSRGSIPRGALGELLAQKFALDLYADLTVIFEDLPLEYYELKQTDCGDLWLVEKEKVSVAEKILNNLH